MSVIYYSEWIRAVRYEKYIPYHTNTRARAHNGKIDDQNVRVQLLVVVAMVMVVVVVVCYIRRNGH